jgi:hypothetical protein
MRTCSIKVGDIWANIYTLGDKFIVRWKWFGVSDKIVCNCETDAMIEYRKKAEAIYSLLKVGKN